MEKNNGADDGQPEFREIVISWKPFTLEEQQRLHRLLNEAEPTVRFKTSKPAKQRRLRFRLRKEPDQDTESGKTLARDNPNRDPLYELSILQRQGLTLATYLDYIKCWISSTDQWKNSEITRLMQEADRCLHEIYHMRLHFESFERKDTLCVIDRFMTILESLDREADALGCSVTDRSLDAHRGLDMR
jgi:hypothetical protein